MVKIADVRGIPLAIPLSADERPSPWWSRQARQVIVEVETDEGVVGLGEAFALGGQRPVCQVIQEMLRPLLVGEDPTRVEYLAEKMQRATFSYGRRGLAMFAISGVDIALWDLLGKIRGLPLYDLLGGLTRPRLEAYASLLRYDSVDDVVAACTRWAGHGYRLLKLHQIDVPSVDAARATLGPDREIMLDVNCPWTPAEALTMARALEPYRLYWLEEPIWPPEDYRALAGLRRRAPMPIALGENESTAYGFREIIARRAADVLQPSVIKVGGVSELRRIAALAEAANIPVVPHSFYLGPGLAATLHVAATFHGTAPVEFPALSYEVPFLSEPIVGQAGWLRPPAGPGLGITLNPDALQRYAVE